jgi:hypothetical protein
MMDPCPIRPTARGRLRPSMDAESPSAFPPSLWSQMDPANHQQLARQIATLIRRIRLPNPEMEVSDHEPC